MCDPFTVQGAIQTAAQKKKNTYIISEEMNRRNTSLLVDSMKRIPGRIRLCFHNCLLLAEAVQVLDDYFQESYDVDGLIFLNTKIQNFESFCLGIGNCESLSLLSFTSCQLRDDDIDLIIGALRKLKHIRVFDISSDHIGPVAFSNICRALSVCKELTTFQWTRNQLGEPNSFIDLVKAVPTLTNIIIDDSLLSVQWRQALYQILDENWQITNIKTTDLDPQLLLKIKRNNQRYQTKCNGLSTRMCRYAQPINDSTFDEF